MPDEPAEDRAQSVATQGGMQELGIQVDGVVVATPLPSDVYHVRPPQVGDETPGSPPS